MFIYLGRKYLIPIVSSCRAISCSDRKVQQEKLDGGSLAIWPRPKGVGKRLINGEWVDVAVGPESFRLHIELSQQVFNDISLGGIKTWVSQILKSAEFCLRHFPHILPTFVLPLSIQRCRVERIDTSYVLMFFHSVFFLTYNCLALTKNNLNLQIMYMHVHSSRF